MHVLSIRICPRDQRAYLISTILDNRCPRPVCSPWYKIIARDDHRDQGRCPCHPWNLHFAIHFLIAQRVQCVKDNIQIEMMSMGWTSFRSWLFEDLCQRFSVHMRQRCHHCTGPGHPLCSLLTATHLKHPKTIAACWKPICNTSKISENNRKQAKRTAGYTLIGNTFETRPYFQKQLETRLMITDGFAGWSKIKLNFYVYCFFSGVVLLLYQNRKDNRNFS